ncbi:hypothetical protein [Siccirubricoccus phaeus]|uniref:hypothetical protein n=1 Tax=Siccirubricoccus phaeus TaxID=2595053 RepID=UPI0011F21682|nr:hypothetical protein [Siccirubricoccus phaeus]
MLARLGTSPLARLIGLLAVLLALGLGNHAHASAGGGTLVLAGAAPIAAEAQPGGEDGGALPAAAHCALCHVAQGLLPEPAAMQGPALRPERGIPSRAVLPADLALPEGPARPPRPMRAA